METIGKIQKQSVRCRLQGLLSRTSMYALEVAGCIQGTGFRLLEFRTGLWGGRVFIAWSMRILLVSIAILYTT